MEQRLVGLHRLELGGGRISGTDVIRLAIPANAHQYADAQLDDYGAMGTRRAYLWRPGTRLTLRARFSHQEDVLVGTAGFGFWNAPFGDPSVRRPALPQATWFFFAAPPTDLPLAPDGPGRGWFASTIDATQPRALALIPFAPAVLLANQSTSSRQRMWPSIRRRLGISFAPIENDMTGWHTYRLDWEAAGCRFWVDDACVLETPHAPAGPLGFVCWIDNQYLVATLRGRISWGVTPTPQSQWLEVAKLAIQPIDPNTPSDGR
jgi:hypothetical protein